MITDSSPNTNNQTIRRHNVSIVIPGAVGIVALILLVFLVMISGGSGVLLSPVAWVLLWVGAPAIAMSMYRLLTKIWLVNKRPIVRVSFGLIGGIASALIFLIIVGLIAGIQDKTIEKSHQKAERDSFTLLSPTNNSIVSRDVVFIVSSSRQLSRFDFASRVLKTVQIDHVTIFLSGPIEKVFTPQRNRGQFEATMSLQPGTYTAYIREEPPGDQLPYAAWRDDHPDSPPITFQVQ